MSILVYNPSGGGSISNGEVINGIANFWQSTAPTERLDASPLQNGDIWNSPTDRYFYNSPYWIGSTLISLSTERLATGGGSGTSQNFGQVVPESGSALIYVEDIIVIIDYSFSGPDASNYHTIEVGLTTAISTTVAGDGIIYSKNTDTFVSDGAEVRDELAVDTVYDLTALSPDKYCVSFDMTSVTGSPPATSLSCAFNYRRIA